MTKKKHEELVEEIATTINKRVAVYHPKLGLVYGKIHKDTATKMAKSFIALILSAVRDGLALPDEQWRADFEGYIHTNKFGKKHGVIDGHLRDWKGRELEPTASLIALRPLTGTGKEEE